MKELQVAIIGCGGIHHSHARCLADVENVRLAAVCDNKPERAEASAKQYGAKAYTNYEEVLALPEIDVVHITLPHYLHAPVAIAALKAGKYVLCEKPMATSVEDARAMAAAANGRLGMVFQNRYLAASRMLKSIVDSGEYGKLQCVRGAVNWYRGPDYYSDDWHGKKALEGGGVMMNQAIHTLDMVQWLGGPVLTVAGQVDTLALRGVIEVEDSAQFRIRFENGAVGTFSATTGFGFNDEVEIEAVLEKGVFWQKGPRLYRRDPGKPMELLCDAEQTPPMGKDYWGSGHIRQITDFYRSIREGSPIVIDGKEGFNAFALVQAVYASAAAGGAEVPVARL